MLCEEAGSLAVERGIFSQYATTAFNALLYPLHPPLIQEKDAVVFALRQSFSLPTVCFRTAGNQD